MDRLSFLQMVSVFINGVFIGYLVCKKVNKNKND